MGPSPYSKKHLDKYCFWGIDNKDAVINVKGPSKPSFAVESAEVNSFDHTCNLYMAVAAMINCGIQGLKSNLKLPEPVPYNLNLTKQAIS